MKERFVIYRDHLCYVSEDWGDGTYDLTMLGEQLVGGGYVRCDCAREIFSMVNPAPDEFLELLPAQPQPNQDWR